MFGINKVTGRGRQTIEALKNQQGDVDTSTSGVLNNIRVDNAECVFGTDGKASHSHTFKLGKSTAAYISYSASNYQYSYDLLIKVGDYVLCEYSNGETFDFGIGVMVNNGFIQPLPNNTDYINNGDPFDAVKKFVSVPIFEGDAKLGNISVVINYSGDPADKNPFTSTIKVNFN